MGHKAKGQGLKALSDLSVDENSQSEQFERWEADNNYFLEQLLVYKLEQENLRRLC